MKGTRVVLGVLAGAALLAGCQESGSSLSFAGKVVDNKQKPVSAFAISVSRSPQAQAKPVSVATKNGSYQVKVPIDGPAVAGSKVLGTKNEPVAIQITANGYKPKTFKVTADQVLVTEPNTLNVTLEPAQ
jgi:uncharacterized lipoprotein YajG